MEQLSPALRSALWGMHDSHGTAHSPKSEKIWARFRWLALGLWWCLSRGIALPGVQPVVLDLIFLLGVSYCGFTHYLAYRLQQARPIVFPVTLTDVVFVTLLCGVSGGIHSDAYPYFYGITLATAIRFGWAAGLCLAVVNTCLTLGLWFSMPERDTQVGNLGLQILYLFCVGGLSGILSQQDKNQYRQAVHERENTERLHAVDRVLVTLELNMLLQRLVDALVHLLPCRGAGVILLNRRNEQAERVATAGQFPLLTAPDLVVGLAEGGLLREALEQGVVILDTPHAIRARPYLRQIQDVAQQNLLILPIIGPTHPQPVGCLLLADKSAPAGFSPDDVRFLTAVAEQTAIAIENARLLESTCEAENQLRGLLHTVISAQEEERRRLVEAWHDRLGTKLFEILQGLRSCQELILQRVPESKARFEQLAAEIDSMAAIVRGFTDELYPAVLDDFGFVTALHEYVARLREHALFRVTVQAEEPVCQLPTMANLTLFRITQEALQNIHKHAQARHVQIAFVQEHSGVSLMIKDDGQGFNPEQPLLGHYGLLYMRERVEACGGTLRVSSIRGQGTEVRVNVPTR